MFVGIWNIPAGKKYTLPQPRSEHFVRLDGHQGILEPSAGCGEHATEQNAMLMLLSDPPMPAPIAETPGALSPPRLDPFQSDRCAHPHIIPRGE
jgi:hypothetical protein